MFEPYCQYEKRTEIKAFENITIICYVPNLFEDKIKPNESKNIESPQKDTIYRFYGIESKNVLIGYGKYSLSLKNKRGELETMDIRLEWRRMGLGSILLNESLSDIIVDFPYLEIITVTSTSDAIPFYLANDFTPYFGDNNLERKLIRK